MTPEATVASAVGGVPPRTSAGRLRLTTLEACVGVPLGSDPFCPALPRLAATEPPRHVIERALLPALSRSPCLVTFSGGRDSSALLALATRSARREGLPDPVPVTNRFPGVSDADESMWQESVVRHLRLSEWVRVPLTDELDLVGPTAGALLRRHGVVMPCNAHFFAPLLARATGGSLIVGVGGDELLAPVARATLAALVFERQRPRRRDARALLGEALPSPVRYRRLRADYPVRDFTWLRPVAREAIIAAAARDDLTPLAWDASVARLWRSRYFQAIRSTLGLLSEDHGVTVCAPFTEPDVLAGLAAWAGRRGLGDRARILPSLAGDWLPPDLARRRSKAAFDPVFFHRHSRAFAQGWDGAGVDDDLVDTDELRREWQQARPRASSFSLLQQAWLESGARAAVAPAPLSQRGD